MEQATRNKLRKVVTQCRKLLEESIAQQLEGQFGIRVGKKDAVQIEDEARMSHLSGEDQQYRRDLLDHLEHIKARSFSPKDSLDQLIREIAFTHLNRLCAYKMMEAREVYVGGQKFRESVGRGINSNGFKFYLADHPDDERLFNTGEQELAYRHFLDWLGGLLSEEIGVLFNPNDPANRLYPRQKTLDELLDLINDEELSGIWEQDETIGWVYQYFTPKELRDQARKESQAPRNSYELAFRNQFFTPRYVVEFLTDNTLGRIWYEMRKGDTKLKDQCRYIVCRPNEIFLNEGTELPENAEAQDDLSQEELLKQPFHIPHRPKKDPRELKILDPACGSGHFLLYCFDLLLTIYEEAYTDPDLGPALQQDYAKLDDLRRDVPRLILAHNLHGIDIDLRCTQIAALALWLRCQRAYQGMGLMKNRPKISRSNFVCAEPMPGEEKLLAEFVSQLEPKLLGQLVEVVFDKMKLAGEVGSLLKIEQELRDSLATAKTQWLAGPVTIQRSLFDVEDPKPQQQPFDFSGISDDKFFEQAEGKVVEALRHYAENCANGKRLQRRLFADDAIRGFAFVDLCRNRFDVVLMNPPFGLAPSNGFAYMKTAYPRSYTELLATVVDRGAELCDGLLGAITSRAFMVATRLKVWRKELVAERIRLMADLGEAIMDDAFVEAASYVLDCNTRNKSASLITFDVRKFDEKELALQNRCSLRDDSSTHFINVSAFFGLPNTKILYSLPASVLRLLQSSERFEPSIGTARQGITTWDDFRFIRTRWEVSPSLIGQQNVWEHLSKGGPYSRFFGDIHLLVKWDRTGDEIRAENFAANGSDAQARQASDYWRRAGATYSIRSQKGFSARALPEGCLFTSQGPSVLSESHLSNGALLGWLNSELITTLVELQSNDGKFMSGIIKHLPWVEFSEEDLKYVATAAENAAIAIRRFFAADETNSVFSGLPVAESLREMAATLNGFATEANTCTREADASINKIVYQNYAVDRSVVLLLRQQLDFADADEADSGSDQEDTAVEEFISDCECVGRVLSACIGIVFGRWSPDRVFPVRTPLIDRSIFDSLPSISPAQRPDEGDDSIPLLETDSDGLVVDDAAAQDDIARRVREVLDVTWRDQAEGIEKEACDILGVKTLRDYFRKPGKGGFWDDHLKRYSKSRRKAPIYWLLQSSNKNYALWLYYHRLDKDMLFKALLNYVEPKIQREENRLAELRSQKSSAGDTGKAAKKTDRDIEKQEDLLTELRDFEEKLRKVADLHLVPDLNDGVVLNIAPLHELVPWKEAKKYWNELMDGKYEWSSIGKQLREKGLLQD